MLYLFLSFLFESCSHINAGQNHTDYVVILSDLLDSELVEALLQRKPGQVAADTYA